MCVSVCFFVPYAWPQFRADVDQIWHMASLYPQDGYGGGVSKYRSILRARAPLAICMPLQISGRRLWTFVKRGAKLAPSRNAQLQGRKHNGSYLIKVVI